MFPGHRLQYCVYYMMLGCKVNYTMPGCKVNYMMLGCKVNYTMLGCKVNYMMLGCTCKVNYTMLGCKVNYMMPGCKVNYMMPGCKVNTEVQYCVYCMMLRCKVNTDVITSVWRTSDRMGSSKVLLPQKKKLCITHCNVFSMYGSGCGTAVAHCIASSTSPPVLSSSVRNWKQGGSRLVILYNCFFSLCSGPVV